MQKQGMGTVTRHALSGAAFGGGAAALVNLVHMLNKMREARAKALKPTEIDENTIVLTLPPKRAEINDAHTKVKSVEGPESADFVLNRKSGQSRRMGSMQFGPRLCSTEKQAGESHGWPTLTASSLAALGGGVGGYMLVNKLYEMHRERRLQQELSAAKKEYMDLLSGNAVKGASCIENAFGWQVPGDEKQAGSTFGLLNYPLSWMALLSILGAGATGYITKRVLDEQFRAVQDKSLDIPKVKRIVFRSAPATDQDPEKVATADDSEAIMGGLMVMMDRVSGTHRFTGSPELKPVLEKIGMTKEALVKEANDWDMLYNHLEQAPDLRKALYGLYTRYTSNPVTGFFKRLALNIPAVQRKADRRLYSMLDTIRNQVPRGGMRWTQQVPNTYMQPKVAQDATSKTSPLVALALASGVLGRTVSQGLTDHERTPEEMAQLIASAQEQADERRRMLDTKVQDDVQVAGADPKAKKYVIKNRAAIQALVKRLAAEGQV
jgi:hypothetical protein